MRKDILLKAEQDFYLKYPLGGEDPVILEIKKKHNTLKLSSYFKNAFQKEMFDYLEKIILEMIKVVQRSSMVSIFEKSKFKDFAKTLSDFDKELLANGLYTLLYENQEQGFYMMLDVLEKGKLAKWTIISTFLYYSDPYSEVFCKPTTMKDIIKILEINYLKYNSHPSYQFYVAFRDLIMEIKSICNVKMGNDNAAITGFLMMSLPFFDNY